MRTILGHLAPSGKFMKFEHPVRTGRDIRQFSGYVVGSREFEDTSLLETVVGSDQKTRKIRFSSDLGQDGTLFAVIQISYFLKYQRLLREDHVWNVIYRMYNDLSME